MTPTLDSLIHGGIDPDEVTRLGLRPGDVLDFSANLNPYGPSATVRTALARTAIDRYPDRRCSELRRVLARRHAVDPDQVLVGNGSVELIWLAAVAHLGAGDGVVILGPTFSEYERAGWAMGARVTTCQAVAEDGFRPPLDDFARAVAEERPRLACLASPNNPTGQEVAADRVRALARSHSETLFVLDEAYVDFVADAVDSRGRSEGAASCSLEDPPNLLRLRSLTKAYGLAGLRLGYAIAAAEVLDSLRAVQPPWSVNALAQAAGLAALADEYHLRGTLVELARGTRQLIESLRRGGFAPVTAKTHFFLLPVGDARRVRDVLLRRGVLVRDCTSFGLPGHIRISSRTPIENDRLVATLLEENSWDG